LGDDVADRQEALAILTALVREGRTTAAIALARALRDEAARAEEDELDRVPRGDE
jgi:hypothetical protein